MIATPWEDEATTASYHDALAANPGQSEVAATLLHFGFVLLLPAALGLMHLARRATPKLAHIGGLLAVFGLATLPGLLVTDFYDLALAEALPRAQSVAIADATQESWAAAVMGMSAVFPVFIGTVVLAVAAYRAGVAPIWAPFALVVGWLLPIVSGTGLVPAVAGALLIAAVFMPIGAQGRPDERSGVGRASGRPRPHQAREGAEDRGGERRLIGEMAGIRRARLSRRPRESARRLHDRRPAAKDPRPSRRTSRRGRWRRPPDGTGRPTRGGRCGSPPRGRLVAVRRTSTAPGRRLEAVLVPVQRVRAGRDRAQHRVVAIEHGDRRPGHEPALGSRMFSPPCARESNWAPRQTPSTGISRATASRSSSASVAPAPGSQAACSPPRLTIAVDTSRSGQRAEVLLDGPSGSAAWPRNGWARWWMTAMRGDRSHGGVRHQRRVGDAGERWSCP